MSQVKAGDTVRMTYVGTLDSGEMFDSSEGREPLEFVVGSGQVIKGLDAAIPGMAVGDKKDVNVPCAQAYGDVNPDARQAVPRDQIPAEIPCEVGTQLQMQTPQGQVVPVTVAEVTETEVTLDANHPLAGQDLNFAIEIVGIDAA
ncbi:peptidylprolyl isomerase [Yoonia sp. F2084L]|uniref:FKBP-type peptidyl-prolyl cis-trans isomerase n=1 Tax=Yoonia sp. F2084L TaxID=2926419 RepID=UPI001FF2F985|nr:peptidylprolyl isomerase [Yoonia sp. F2084L]MCK0096502.1 peptidylprolyl isomerase [Yoonia sp. F2084L]